MSHIFYMVSFRMPFFDERLGDEGFIDYDGRKLVGIAARDTKQYNETIILLKDLIVFELR